MTLLKNKYGFTLLELMIIIVILGVLAALISGNFITSLKKGRDARRKADLQQIQKALEMYYEDNKEYPEAGGEDGELDITASGTLCHPEGCDTKTYMYKIPIESKTGCQYLYVHEDSDGEGYSLYSTIENNQDVGQGIKLDGSSQDPNGYSDKTCGTCKCIFKVSSPNYP